MSENETRNELLTPSEKEGNLTSRRNKTVDFIAKFVCLLIAFFLWYYAKGTDTSVRDEVFSDIRVEVVNNSGFSVLSGDGMTVDLTLSGKRNVIRKVLSSEIRAYVDISYITEAGWYTLDIQYELPNGTTLEKSTSSSLKVYVDNTASITLPVRVDVINYTLEDGYELRKNAITTDPDKIVVTGPESIIDTLSYASLTVDIGGYLNGSVTYKGEIVLIDSEGNIVKNSYVKTDETVVTATIPVYRERVVPIVIRSEHGYFNTTNCEIKPSLTSLTVYGAVETVNAINLSFVIDEKTVKGNATLTYGITLPPSVQNRSGETSLTVSVVLKDTAVATFLVNVEVRGDSDKTYAPVTATVTLRGDAELMKTLTVNNFRVIADVKGLTDLSAVPLTFAFDSSLTGHVYEIYENGTPYTVSVTEVAASSKTRS